MGHVLINFEGPELSGKTGAAQRVSQVLSAAIPQLEKVTQKPIDYLHTREPGGSPGADTYRQFIKIRWAIADDIGKKTDQRNTAHLFTLARRWLYEEKIHPFLNNPGNHLITSDRTWISMMALQGSFEDADGGVPLEELEKDTERIAHAIKPDVVILRQFPPSSMEQEVSFRQLYALTNGREIMPKDLLAASALYQDQRKFELLAQRYEGQIDFVPVDASLDPLSSTSEDLEIIGLRIAQKLHYPFEVVQTILGDEMTKLQKEGQFKDVEAMMTQQNELRIALEQQGASAVDVMNRYRAHRDNSEIEMLKQLYEERLHLRDQNPGMRK